jgi:hypothetical protein
VWSSFHNLIKKCQQGQQQPSNSTWLYGFWQFTSTHETTVSIEIQLEECTSSYHCDQGEKQSDQEEDKYTYAIVIYKSSGLLG